MTGLVIGFGNEDAGDDAAGRLVARRLAGRDGLDATVRERRTPPAELFTEWDGFDLVILVDAVLDERPAGSVLRWDLVRDALPARQRSSSHGFGLGEAVELARALGRLPPRLIAYGIVADPAHRGEGCSAAVAAAVERTAADVAAECCTGERDHA